MNRLLLTAIFMLGAIHAFAADAPPDPSKLTDSIKIFLGKKYTLHFQQAGGVLKKPEISEKDDPKQPGVSLDFKQEDGMVILDIKNNFSKTLRCRCLARLKGKTTYFETDLVPIPAGLSDYESWQDSIEEFVLFDFKLTDEKE